MSSPEKAISRTRTVEACMHVLTCKLTGLGSFSLDLARGYRVFADVTFSNMIFNVRPINALP